MGLCIQEQKGELYRLEEIKKICVNGQRRAGNAERNAGHV